MKRTALITIAVATGLAISTANAGWFSSNKPALKTQMDKVSYTIGYDMGHSFQKNNVKITPTLFKQGMQDAISNKKPALTKSEMKQVMTTFQKEMMGRAIQHQKEMATQNQTASDAYMAKIAKQPGVKMIEKGLYYKVIKAGVGTTPTKNDMVTVNYAGTLINGKVFDSSYKRGKPTTFKVDQVIPGWTKALEKMPQGATWVVYIAPNLAYGKFAPPSIGPNQALTFKIDLISIKPASSK